MPDYKLTYHALNRMAERGINLGAWLFASQDAEWYDDGKRVKVVVRNWNATSGSGKASDLIIILNHQQTMCITVIRDHRGRSRRWRH